MPSTETSAVPGLAEAHAAFARSYPAFAGTAALDALRASDYARLDSSGQTYLDYTGAGLYAESQLRRHLALLSDSVLGNPHSQSLPSRTAGELVERARVAVGRFLGADPDEYDVIFTPNATGALRLVGEAFPFGVGDQYLLTFDNHNSVNGIREFAAARGADVRYVTVAAPELRVPDDALAEGLARARPGGHNLFAYPAQSNFSGVQHPLEWIARAQDAGWRVLLDAAAFVPTNALDLGRWHPDFVSLSFYKMFGYPTGLGALLARKDALATLHRPWFGGGNLTYASVQAFDCGIYRTPGAQGFEDGTVDYLSIPAVEIGLEHLSAVGMDAVHTRVACLTGWLLDTLGALRHRDGRPLVRIYGPADLDRRGGTIAFNLTAAPGELVDSREVERRANAAGIALRSGCHCNPGAGEIAFAYTRDDMAAPFAERDRLSYEDFLKVIDRKKSGAARASVGLASTFADVHRFAQFLASFAR